MLAPVVWNNYELGYFSYIFPQIAVQKKKINKHRKLEILNIRLRLDLD